MSTSSKSQAQAFKQTVEAKLQALVVEFAEGKISREQFHVLYERYNNQLTIASQSLMSGSEEALTIAQSGPPTLFVRDSLMGKALGMLIYHNSSGTILETLGDFNVPVSLIAPALNDISAMMQADRLIDRRVEAVGAREWVLFVAGQHSTVVTLFRNEPSQVQMREIERLQHDFEVANRAMLARDHVDSGKLAYPFLVFVKKKFSGR